MGWCLTSYVCGRNRVPRGRPPKEKRLLKELEAHRAATMFAINEKSLLMREHGVPEEEITDFCRLEFAKVRETEAEIERLRSYLAAREYLKSCAEGP
jgi:hypothetical protein